MYARVRKARQIAIWCLLVLSVFAFYQPEGRGSTIISLGYTPPGPILIPCPGERTIHLIATFLIEESEPGLSLVQTLITADDHPVTAPIIFIRNLDPSMNGET